VTAEPADQGAGAAARHGSLRAAHADRELVISALKTAFTQGRLTKDELDLRVSRAFASRTYAELGALTADISAGGLTARHGTGPARGSPGPPDTRLSICLSYSPADEVGRLLRRRLADRFDIIMPDMMIDRITRITALRRSLMSTDVAVAVFPAADDPLWHNVIFEAGAAAGAGGPLVLVGQAASVPADLADSPVFEPDQLDDAIALIRELGPRPRKWLIQNVSGVSGFDLPA
jgi:hypothetical protein